MTNEPRPRPNVVIDTNVLVSGVIVPLGNPNRLLTAWEHNAFTLVTSPELIHEIDDVLHRQRIRRKYPLPEEQVQAIVMRLHTTTRKVTPLSQVPLESRDPKDTVFLAVALAGQADYLVTGDRDLLTLSGDPALGRLKVVTVREFLDEIELA